MGTSYKQARMQQAPIPLQWQHTSSAPPTLTTDKRSDFLVVIYPSPLQEVTALSHTSTDAKGAEAVLLRL